MCGQIRGQLLGSESLLPAPEYPGNSCLACHLISFVKIDIIAINQQLESTVAAVIVRSLPDETLRALKQRAAKAGRSTEAEIREILSNVVRSPFGMGSALARIGRQLGGMDFEPGQKRGTVRPARLS